MPPLLCRVTNANLPVGDNAIWTAPLPPGLESVPRTVPVPCSAFATLSTWAPLPDASGRDFPSGVIASPLFAPDTEMVCTSAGASDLPLLSTASEWPSVTNENLPSAVTWTAKGLPPSLTEEVVTLLSRLAAAATVVQPGIFGATAPVVPPPPPPPPPPPLPPLPPPPRALTRT